MKTKLLSLLFLLCISTMSHAQTQTINVADYGITPKEGVDATLPLVELLDNIAGKEGITLSFPKGVYHFYPENAIERYCAVTNHDNGLRRIGFALNNFKNLTLDGNGSTFLYYGKMSPIMVDASDRVTFKNFTIDFDRSPIDEMEVIAVDKADNSFIAKVRYPKYGIEVKKNVLTFKHYDWNATLSRTMPYDPKTKTLCFNTSDFYIAAQKAKITKLSDTTVKIKDGVKKLPPIGTVYCNTSSTPWRNGQAIHLFRSSNILIENVTIKASLAMGVIAERVENVSIRNSKITPNDGRYYSVGADATHFNGCKGLVKVDNSTFENMGDDAINVHGSYVNVVEYLGENKYLCELSHFQQYGFIFADKGDRLMLTSRQNLDQLFECQTTNVKVLNEKRFVLTVDKTPEVMPKGLLTFENLTWYPDVEVRNCTIHRNRARSALISTKGNVIMENNYFSSQMHGILIEGDNKAWYESGGVRNVLIKNNIFENVGLGVRNGTGYPLFVSPMLNKWQTLGTTQYHEHVQFVGNTIKGFHPRLVYARSVKNLTVEGNTVERIDTYPADDKSAAAVKLDFCDEVIVKGNVWKGFETAPVLEVEKSTKVVIEGNNPKL